ncbi:anti-sigma factor [Agrobacterium sp. ES01]|uniref:anti-sigma factor n=1 Tax=Agrobacterium sp. ES01 TaxID=3420714 RepID=UPI003D115FFA
MTTPDQSKGERSRDEVLAGEYVLGVLATTQRREVEERMRNDRRFADIVFRWEENLSRFNDDYEEHAAPEFVFERIEERLFGKGDENRAMSGGVFSIWQSLVFWRGVSFSALFMLAGLAGFEIADRLRPGATPLIAEMSGEDNAISLVARYDDLTGTLKVTPVAAGPAEPKSLELWLIEGNDAPRSLGVLPQSGEGEIIVPPSLKKQLKAGVTLAVSVEPLGGSPTGQATGPVIAVGAAHL